MYTRTLLGTQQPFLEPESKNEYLATISDSSAVSFSKVKHVFNVMSIPVMSIKVEQMIVACLNKT